ncbi:unnamed protein product [Sphenostylis stenocarpa]|uniref:Uncharacterized protein n=1 Tax=Sphenostylis stenocarpa TaxID=92480 RepID=A0AA86VUF8_9FABA|nr:unnamed protein product [Sphenostylis stenocarpa]
MEKSKLHSHPQFDYKKLKKTIHSFSFVMAETLESTQEVMNGREEEDEVTLCMEKMLSFVVPMALRTTVELGVFDILAKAGEGGKLCAEEIAVEIGSKNPEAPAMVDRLLSLLNHTLGGSTPSLLLPNFVSDPHGVSLGSSVKLLLDPIFYKSWSELKEAIVEGGVAFDRAHGMHAFEYSGVDPRFNQVFNNSMTALTTLIMKRILEFYNGFLHVTKLVDVGGGYGVNLKLITSKYPHIEAINFDLPHVVENAPVYSGYYLEFCIHEDMFESMRGVCLSHSYCNPAGVEHVGGDMFEGVPSGDAIFMKWILHDWSDEHCVKVLKNCYKAIPDDGKVIVVDSIVSMVPEKSVTAKSVLGSDLMMMIHNPGGKERTRQEFIELAEASGFSGVRFICCVCCNWAMEFHK